LPVPERHPARHAQAQAVHRIGGLFVFPHLKQNQHEERTRESSKGGSLGAAQSRHGDKGSCAPLAKCEPKCLFNVH
jgi:hypothetical protein